MIQFFEFFVLECALYIITCVYNIYAYYTYYKYSHTLSHRYIDNKKTNIIPKHSRCLQLASFAMQECL